jgi:tetratricopeptide (TPR) repeat protein
VVPIAAQQLPPEILADQYLLEAKRLYENGQYPESCRSFAKVVQLGVQAPIDFYFFYGRALAKCNDYVRAQAMLTKYVLGTGQQGEHYQKALEQLSSVEEAIKHQERVAIEKREQAARERAWAEEKAKRAAEEAKEKAKTQARDAFSELAYKYIDRLEVDYYCDTIKPDSDEYCTWYQSIQSWSSTSCTMQLGQEIWLRLKANGGRFGRYTPVGQVYDIIFANLDPERVRYTRAPQPPNTPGLSVELWPRAPHKSIPYKWSKRHSQRYSESGRREGTGEASVIRIYVREEDVAAKIAAAWKGAIKECQGSGSEEGRGGAGR